ncbi:MAG: amidohydrolase family protein [Planctomycetota bacterium]|jgi:imidazolonepropionase-like amidohydrolase
MTHSNRTHTRPVLNLKHGLVGLALAAAPALANEKLVIEAGVIHLANGESIEDGVIVVDGGRITAVGAAAEVETPWDAPVMGGADFVAFPGFVEAHANRGMDRANENVDVAPFLDVRDSIDPINLYFEDCLRWGTTTVNVQQGNDTVVAARGRVVRPIGMTVEEMTVRPLHGIKLSASPKSGKGLATQAQSLRAAFDDLRRYLEEIIDDARQGGDLARREALFQGRDWEAEDPEGRAMVGEAWTVDGLELIPRGAIDEKQAPLLALVEGRLNAYFYCGDAREVHTAIDIAKQNGFLHRTTFVLGSDTWKAADVIAATGRPVILQAPLESVEIDPLTGDEERTFVPGVFAEKGITFALSAQGSSSNSLGFQAARAVALGLDRQAAIDAVTTAPAEILGLGDQVGSLAVGNLANVLLMSGDPLGAQSWVEHAFIEGQHVYDRSKDTRNKYIFEGQQPVGAGTSDGPGMAGPISDER